MRNASRADDLVQETLVKAWANHEIFEPGTNLRAWLHTILRNEFYSQMRKKAREIEDSDGALAARLAVHPGQQGHMDMVDFRKALSLLPDDQRGRWCCGGHRPLLRGGCRGLRLCRRHHGAASVEPARGLPR